jgi:UDP-N-acetyl-D-glucosamine 4,6-dehydratase
MENSLIYRPTELKRMMFFTLLDIFIIFLAVLTAYGLRFDFEIPSIYTSSIYFSIFILVLSRVTLFYYFKIYNISWKHFGFRDTTRLVYVIVFSTVLLIVATYLARNSSIVIPRSIIAIEFFISLFMILALRISKRLYLENYRKNELGKNTLIIAGIDNANNILRTISNKESLYFPVAIVNDSYKGMKVNGVDVYSLENILDSECECEAAIVDETINLPEIYDKLSLLNIKDIKVASDYSDYGVKINVFLS